MTEVWQEWVEKAQDDLRLAQGALDLIPGRNFDGACYHAQQGVEKLMKAVLVRAGAFVRKTHDLLELSTAISAEHPTWHYNDLMLAELTRAATAFRYPGEEATEDEARRLVLNATTLQIALAPWLMAPSPPAGPNPSP